MNKLVAYTILVIGTLGFLLIFGLVNSGMKEIVYEKNGVQFELLKKNKALQPSGQTQFFTSQSGDELTFYMNEGYHNLNYSTRLSVYQTSNLSENVHSLAVKALNNEIQFQSATGPLNKDQMLELVSSLTDFRGAQLTSYTSESGWFGYLDDTVVIFIILGFQFFIACLIINSLSGILSRKYNKKLEWIIPSVLILILSYLSTKMNFTIWFSYSEVFNVFRNFGTILFPYLLVRFLLHKAANRDFADKELLKFFGIILGTYIIGYILSQVGFAWDSGKYKNVMMIEKHGPHPLVMGLAISLAAGNLLANLVLRMIKMRGSEKILKKTELALNTSTANLHSLQSTINPHFLYNSLNSIASTAKVDGNKTEKMALALSSFYKYITNKSNESITTISEEVEMLENYLKIEKIRFEEVLKVDFDINSNVLSCKLPRLLLQPLVENAIKYGYGESGINVKITAEKISDQLIIRIYDSGTDFGTDMQIGFGIKSVAQKLEMLYADQHTLEFKNSPSKHIQIKINQNEVK